MLTSFAIVSSICCSMPLISNHRISSTSVSCRWNGVSNGMVPRNIISWWRCLGVSLWSGIWWTSTRKISFHTVGSRGIPDSSWNSRIAAPYTSISPSVCPQNCTHFWSFLWNINSTCVFSSFAMRSDAVICPSVFAFEKANSWYFSIHSIVWFVLPLSYSERVIWVWSDVRSSGSFIYSNRIAIWYKQTP